MNEPPSPYLGKWSNNDTPESDRKFIISNIICEAHQLPSKMWTSILHFCHAHAHIHTHTHKQRLESSESIEYAEVWSTVHGTWATPAANNNNKSN